MDLSALVAALGLAGPAGPGSDPMAVALVSGLGLFVMLAVLILAGSAMARERRQSRRVATTRARALGGGETTSSRSAPKGGEAGSVRRTRKESLPALEKVIRERLPRVSNLRLRLDRSGLDVSPGQFVLACLGVAAAFLPVFLVFVGLALPTALLFAGALGVALPHYVVGMLIRRRRTAFITDFPDAIDLMVRGLKSGLPITETMASVAREMTGPVGQEFTRVVDSVRMGQSMEEALWETSRKVDIQDFKFFVISLSVQRETGGNLGETLGNLSDVLRARKTMKLKIKALSSEARASSYILGGLPFIMFVIISVVNPEYLDPLYSDPRGRLLIVMGLSSITTGFLVMMRMIRFEI